MYGVGLAAALDVELDDEVDFEVDVDLVVEVPDLIVLSSSCPELFSSMIAAVSPATGRTVSPTATAPPIPTPTTIHPTWALTVWPLLIVNVFGVLVGFCVVGIGVVVANGGDDFRVLLGSRLDPRELCDFVFWLLVVFVVGTADFLVLDVDIVE